MLPVSMRPIYLIALTILLGSACLQADEIVYLKSGFSLRAQSHTAAGLVLSFLVGTGTIEIAPEQIVKIEFCAPSVLASPTLPANAVAENAEAVLNRAALAEGLESSFVRSVAKAESGFSASAISPKGAIGLMQLMPATAAGLGVDAARMDDNARGGAKYLRELLLRYHNNSALALAAYNAGPGVVARYGGVPPYAETRQYILRVTREYDRQLKAEAAQAKAAPAGRPFSRSALKSRPPRAPAGGERVAVSSPSAVLSANTTSATN